VPIYEYHCSKCGDFEITQRISDPALKKCPTCRGKVKKLISTTSFQLKGSGWYVTDYGKSGSSKPSKSETSSDSKSESKTESKTETKTESKSDTSSKSAKAAA
jgi:putative FmdB family regulatory protein